MRARTSAWEQADLRASVVWFPAASTGPLQGQTGQSMLLHALLKLRFKMLS